MTDQQRRTYILRQIHILDEAAEYIIENNKNYESQIDITHKRYDGFMIEIESKELGIDVDWIRLYYGDCYMYLYENGKRLYEYDPYSEAGGEIIVTDNLSDFESKVKELTNIDQYYNW